MLNWQSGFDGSKDVGCVAAFVSEKTSYVNEFQRDGGGGLEKVIMSGRGGRGKIEGKHVHVRNQEYHKNYPMFVSAERCLPIRLVVEKTSGIITYQGLWKCIGYTYLPHQKCNDFLVYQFVLVPWREKQ